VNQEISGPTENSFSRPNIEPSRAVCGQFEAAWKSAVSTERRPRIRDFLLTLPENQRSTAFSSLLALELKHRVAAAEQPKAEEYYSLFPDVIELIRSVFEELGLADGTMDFRPSGDTGATSALSNGAAGPHRTEAMDGAAQRTLDFARPDESAAVITKGYDTPNGAARPRGADTERLSPKDRRRLAALADAPVVPGYEILGVLGKGGMGIVYKARHLKLQREVALKMIRPGRGRDFGLEEFTAEARAVAKFQHPNLVQIYHIGEYDGRPYFELELLAGGSLEKQMGGMPQPAKVATALVETIARPTSCWRWTARRRSPTSAWQ